MTKSTVTSRVPATSAGLAAFVDRLLRTSNYSGAGSAGGREDHVHAGRTLTYPPEGFGAPKDRQGHASPAATGLPDGHRGVLGRRPHLARRRHLLRAVPRRAEGPGAAGRLRGRRLEPRHRRSHVPATRVHRRAHAVRPAAGLEHRRHRGSPARARDRRHPPGARLPQRAPRPDVAARPGPPRAVLPHLQRAHRRDAGGRRAGGSSASASSTGGTATAPGARSPR